MSFMVAFDLDGVLYSAEPFLADAYRECIELVNRRRPGSFDRVPESAEIFRHIGWPVPTILARLFPGAHPEAVRLMYDLTLEVICGRVARREGVLYDGAAEVLAELRGDEHELVVASNGRGRYVETVLSTYGLLQEFAPLLAVDTIAAADKADLLRAYMAHRPARRGGVVMVGDRASDVEAARAVGCPFVGCDYGHGNRGEIEGHGPVVSSLRELPAVIRRLSTMPP